ncbi:MAG: DUF3180 domain-containing protein [Salinibacterium sp.]|nr:MAG: DUF3180 domain-containing protein [Salinibacterium sp.]
MWLLETALAGAGSAVLVPPIALPIVLIVIAIVVVVVAVPVRRVSRGTPNARVDPFYATQVLALAKASSLSAALLTGAGLGIVAFLLTRGAPAVASIGLALAATAGAVGLLIGGLVAEHWCRIPPTEGGPTSQPAAGQ